ncbi:S41 family peptidase [Rubrolithibacter danxiaensis]|uniref:S41 family peptidase n=1 Tax=Rubrolithibacter danxiaensis TaxID=3390805 RepID=UPI003BF8772C
MKKNSTKYLIWVLLITFIAACKKDPQLKPEENVSPETGTRTELSLDSIYLYAKQTYLWYDQLPGYQEFNPRQFASFQGDEESILNSELYTITQIPVNPQTGKPYEYVANAGYPKYSFLNVNTNISGSLSAVDLEGSGDDLGFKIQPIEINNSSYDFRIKYVEVGSPAYKAGLKRGYRVLQADEENINLDNFDNIPEQNRVVLKVQKPNGSVSTVTLNMDFYESNPVFKKTILTAGTKKVGYVALARFSNLNNSQSVLNDAFSEFANANIENIVVDLRYNGGGYVNTAQYLTNLIAPSSLNNKVMYIEHYNDLMSSDKAEILKKQILYDENNDPVTYKGRTATYFDLDFTEEGNTYKFSSTMEVNGSDVTIPKIESVKNVYFIVTRNTASASELVINNLKPHLNVKIIGSNTYGKPVGFFPIRIDQYEMYIPNFQTRNASGQGDYFSGFTPDVASVDDVTRDFGDPNELCLSKALALIQNGNTISANTTMVLKGNRVMNASSVEVKNVGKDDSFKGLIENRLKLK